MKEVRNGEFYKLPFYTGWSEKASPSRELMGERRGICCYLGKSLKAGETTEANALRWEKPWTSFSSRKQGGQYGWSRRWETSCTVLCW